MPELSLRRHEGRDLAITPETSSSVRAVANLRDGRERKYYISLVQGFGKTKICTSCSSMYFVQYELPQLQAFLPHEDPLKLG